MVDEYSRVDIDLEFPVSIDSILSVHFNAESFKLVFDFVLRTLRAHARLLSERRSDSENQAALGHQSGLLQDLEVKLGLQSSELSSLKSQLESLMAGLNRNQFSSLEEYQGQLSQKLEEILKQGLEDKLTQRQEEMLGMRLDEILSHKFQEITVKQKLSDDDFMQALESRIHRIIDERLGMRQEDFYAQKLDASSAQEANSADGPDLQTQADQSMLDMYQDHESRIQQIELYIKSVTDNALDEESLRDPDSIKETAAEKLSKDIEWLKNQVRRLKTNQSESNGNEDLNSIIGRLKNLENQSEQRQKNFNSFNDIIRELKDQMKDVEQSLNYVSTNNTNYQQGRSLREVYNQTDSFRPEPADLDPILNRLKALEEDSSSKAEDISGLHKFCVSLQTALRNSNGDSPVQVNLEDSRISALTTRVGKLEAKLRNLAIPEPVNLSPIIEDMKLIRFHFDELNASSSKSFKEIYLKYKELETMIVARPTHQDVEKAEDRAYERAVALCDELSSKFADRGQTRRAIRSLEKMCKDNAEPPKPPTPPPDALFARKPLGGWSCASCERNLQKLSGKVGPHHSWNKLPNRDPSERLFRAGPGFSRMLVNINPDLAAQKTKVSLHQITSPDNEEVVLLPPVNRPLTSLDNQ